MIEPAIEYSPVDPAIVKRATELAIQHEDCPWCTSGPGELCVPDRGEPHWSKTHTGRFAGLGTPAEYIARMESAGD